MPHPPSTPRRTPRLAAAATLLLLAGWAAAPSIAEEPHERNEQVANLLAEADRQLDEQRYAAAAETARRAMARADGAHLKISAANLLGLALHRQWSLGLDDASEARLKRLLGAPGPPRVPPAGSDELLAEAAEAFRLAADLDPEGRTAARLNQALALYYLQRDEEAAAAIARHVQRGGAGPEALALDTCLHADREVPLRVGGEVARPEKIAGDNPSYHDLGRAFGVQGTVVLESIIDEAGDVRCLRPLKRLPLGMTEAAMQAVRTWKFKPATLGGQPVKVFYTLTVNFAIDRGRG